MSAGFQYVAGDLESLESLRSELARVGEIKIQRALVQETAAWTETADAALVLLSADPARREARLIARAWKLDLEESRALPRAVATDSKRLGMSRDAFLELMKAWPSRWAHMSSGNRAPPSFIEQDVKQKPITVISRIDVDQVERLRAVGVRTIGSLLERSQTKNLRQRLAKEVNVSESRLLTWVNQADLMRIGGVSSYYSELLDAAGVDSVKDLKHRRADNLAKAMKRANQQGRNRLVKRTPSVKVVQKWIDQAKALPDRGPVRSTSGLRGRADT